MPGENPILNNPYEEPLLHYATNSKGELDFSVVKEGRRAFSSEVQPFFAEKGFAPNRAKHKVNMRSRPPRK